MSPSQKAFSEHSRRFVMSLQPCLKRRPASVQPRGLTEWNRNVMVIITQRKGLLGEIIRDIHHQ